MMPPNALTPRIQNGPGTKISTAATSGDTTISERSTWRSAQLRQVTSCSTHSR